MKQVNGKIRSLLNSFKYAGQGFKTAFTHERNFRIHCIMVILVVVLGIVFHLSFLKWAILFLAMGFVLFSELINTAGEALVDMITKEFSPEAKRVKDILASSVLVAAVVSVIVGIFVFAEPIMKWMGLM